MPLFSTLLTSANALRVIDQQLATTQNNVSNAGTAGYAKQRLAVNSLPFDPAAGLPGGVSAGELQSYRNVYIEQTVRRRQQAWGAAQQQAGDLARVEPLFDVTGRAGIPGALNALLQSFSSLSVTPNDTVARQGVIDRASDLALRFNQDATALNSAKLDVDDQMRGVVDTINRLAADVRALNGEIRQDARSGGDPNLDAKLNATLEELSEYVDITTLRQQDGSTTVLVGGQIPLVMGDRAFPITVDFSGADTAIRDFNGQDVTAEIRGGRLYGLLDTRNAVLPSYITDLNRLAQALAGGVNAVLAGGIDLAGNAGAPLFTYDTAANAAFSLRVTGIAGPELAAALPGAPGGNGNALRLAALADSAAIDGLSFTAFYGGLAGRVGQDVQRASGAEQTQQQLLVQARSLRDSLSGVSLDEEAANVLAFQRAYQASAQLVKVLDELTEITVNLLR
jgi:flagellar hook-associated protein 1 FlgK